MSIGKRLLSIAATIISCIISWFVSRLWLFHGDPNPSFIATIFLIAVIIHELGHFIVMESNGIKAHILFLVLIGGAIPSSERDASRLGELPNSTQAWLRLAGVLGNLFMVIVAIVLGRLGRLTTHQTLQIFNLNGLLILSNLLPVFIFDGAGIAKALIGSIAVSERHSYLYKIGLPISLFAALLGSVTHHILPLLLVIITALALRSLTLTINPRLDVSTMSHQQINLVALTYTTLFIISMFLVTLTPLFYL